MRQMRVTVHYPAERGRLVLRTALDWTRDVEPVAVDPGAGLSRFIVPTTCRPVAFKPMLVRDASRQWAQGDNRLWSGGHDLDVWPQFEASSESLSDLFDLSDPASGRPYRVRVRLPPGYEENPLARHPVVYLQDGPNVFRPEESAFGATWRIAEALDTLDAMQLVPPAIAVAVYPVDRMVDYTRVGYGLYGRYLSSCLVPWVDRRYRTFTGPAHRLVMGSSLGGVVSLHVAWQHADVFGNAACLSSTFGYRDDLARRIAAEPRRPVRVYLDSGWPEDNFEVTLAMRDLLVSRGYRQGGDLLYLAFPHARHHETDWAARVHLPLQFGLAGSSAARTLRRLPRREEVGA